MNVIIRGAGVIVGLGVGASIGCLNLRANTEHCALLDGDETCAERYPGARTFCARGTCGSTLGRDGCTEDRPEDDACYSPCGGDLSILDNSTCLSGSSTGEASSTGTESGSESETGGSESTTGPERCVGDEDCPDAVAAFCEPVSGECVGCDAFGAEGDAACAGLDPENPLVCDDQLLLCDGATNTCTACTEHTQCGSGACELNVGRCFPGDFVVTVDGDGPADYTSLAAAVAAVDEGTHGVIVVHELDGAGSYQTAGMGLRIDGTKTIALLAAAGERPILQGTGGNPGVRVEGAGTNLYIDGLSVAGNTGGLGVLVDGAFTWADRSRIVQNSGGGVLAQAGAELVLRNCFVGGSVTNVAALDVSEATATVQYTTAISGFGMTAVSVRCTAGSSVGVTDSIVLVESNNAPVSCAQAIFERSASEVDILGVTNVGNFDDGSTWFASVAGGDFHLTPSGAMTFADIAEWNTGDPLTDIDGDLRPTVNGTPDYAGADLVP